MRTITLEELLEAGCHFGHQVTRQNPKARDFVFEARDNIHIIDLAKTKEGLEEAAEYVKNLAQKGGTMILLGAKRQAEPVVKEEIARAQEEKADGLYYVTNRWIGGILTNFSEVAKNFRKLKDLTERLSSPEKRAGYTKKEISLWEKEKQKLESFYAGLADMTRIPDAIFIIDTHMEDLAVQEARKMHVTVVGITDTNSDPTLVDYAIPANDDAVGSIKIIADYIVDAWIEGRKKMHIAAEKESAKTAETTKPVEEKKEKTQELKTPTAKTEKKEVKTSEKKSSK